jgi:RTX calcium-binding nonapeptide repeat (4 copies)
LKSLTASISVLALALLAWAAPQSEAAAGVCTPAANYCTDAGGHLSYTLTRQPVDHSDCTWNVSIDFGDGATGHYFFSGNPLVISHTFPHPGFYNVHGTASGGNSPSENWICPSYSVAVTVEYPLNEPCGHEAGETFSGTPGPDRLSAGKGADLVQGGGGDDVIDGAEGGDCLSGDEGIDWLKGGPGADELDGGADADLLDGKDDDDVVSGADGDDFVIGGAGKDSLFGGPGNDILSDGLGKNAYSAGPGDDTISARQSIGEKVNCGPGVDIAYVDKKDKTTGCEQMLEAAPPALAWPDNLDEVEGPGGAAHLSASGLRTLQGSLGDFVRRWAPLVHLYPGERYRPTTAYEYIQMAALRFAHSGCFDHEIKSKGTIDVFKLSSKAWHPGASWTKTPYYHPKARIGCIGHSGREYSTAEHTRPHDKGALGNSRVMRGEGFFLDIPNNAESRAGSSPDTAPVYYECCFQLAGGGWAITYWFFYAYDDKPVAGGFASQKHEADWERISVRFDSALEPQSVVFFAHDATRRYPGYLEWPWSAVEKAAGHPVVYSAQGSHASYPGAGTWELNGLGNWFADDYAGAGEPWRTWQHIANARRQAWWGYGGAWGQDHNLGFNSGPLGPSPWKYPYPKAWD